MKILRHHVIVKIRDSIFIDEAELKGGVKLLINTMFNPERHIKNYGEVVSVPFELAALPVASDPTGSPSYHEDPPYTWKTTQDIEMDVRVGDRVYFHYNCLLPDMGENMFNSFHLRTAKEIENGKEVVYHYFRIKYELIFACVRYEACNCVTSKFEWWMEPGLVKFGGDDQELFVFGGENLYHKYLIPIGSWTFIEPDKETWEDISIPVPVVIDGKVILDRFGKPQLKPKDQWIVTKKAPDVFFLRGYVRFVGKPLRGDDCMLEPGQYVHFRNLANTFVKIEGMELYRMLQRNIEFIDLGRSPKHTIEKYLNLHHETTV